MMSPDLPDLDTGAARLRPSPAVSAGVLSSILILLPTASPFMAGAQSLPSPTPAQPADSGSTNAGLNAEQIDRLLKELATIRDRIVTGKESNNSKALDAFRQASASDRSALDFHLECVYDVNFQQQNRRESDFRDWKNGNDDFLKSPEHMAVLRSQLLYLVAMLEADRREKFEDALPALDDFMAFAGQTELLLANPEKLEGGSANRLRGVAAENVLGTPFAKRYKLDVTLKAPDKWPDSPRELDALYENVLLPHYRASRQSAKLLGAWDQRIGRIRAIAAIAEKEKDARAYTDIMERRLPVLEWGKARDNYSHGNQLVGAQSMLAIIRDNLAHPNAEQWISEFTQLVQGTGGDLAPPTAPSEGATLGDLLDGGGSGGTRPGTERGEDADDRRIPPRLPGPGPGNRPRPPRDRD